MAGKAWQLKTAALIVAGGRGTRAASAVPKQYARIGGEAVLARTLRVFLEHPELDVVQVVIAEGDADRYAAAVSGLQCSRLAPPVAGGPTRQASVHRGLEALKAYQADQVLI